MNENTTTVGVTTDCVTVCSDCEEIVKSLMGSLSYKKPKNFIDAVTAVFSWSHNYTDSRQALESAFNKTGKFTQTYTY